MHRVRLAGPADFAGWRDASRLLAAARVAPEAVAWSWEGATEELFSEEIPRASHGAQPRAPRAFVELAGSVALHRSPEKFALLYRLLWRLQAEPRLMQAATDEDVARATAMEKAVQRDIHKMHAFVRFREIELDRERRYVAWFEPEHHILEATAPFFARRFANMHWSILTPERSAHWDRLTLVFGAGARRTDAPSADAEESLWRTYYASIFNPARLNVGAMRAHMPVKYWRNLPESALIAHLSQQARERTLDMIHRTPTEPARIRRRTAPPAPPSIARTDGSLAEVREHAEHCRDCPLWRNATQTVFGEGKQSARILIVGEQPGDQEDIAGRPFVGPAGRLLDRALGDAGIDRKATYVTNAVKHFKFEPRGKRRIHKKPSEVEISACHQWLERELRLVDPDVVIALGATAARAVFGRATPIGKNRGRVIPADEAQTFTNADVLVTVHPSFLLRVPDEDRDVAYAEFVADLKLVRKYV